MRRQLASLAKASLQAEQHQDLAFPYRQRLEGFADEGAWAVHLDAADLDRDGLHGEAAPVTRHQEVADLDGLFGGVDLDLDAAGGGDLRFGCRSDAEEDAG